MSHLKELDHARDRWRLARRRIGQSTCAGVEPSGLAHRVQDLSARLLILPEDPFATQLSFDPEFWDWWTTEGQVPFDTRVPWTRTEPTTDAAVKYKQGSSGWDAYLAMYRHGGVEVGWNPAWSSGQRRRYLGLVRTVGLVWIGASAQAAAVRRLDPSGPWELTLVLYETRGVLLAGFGSGWAEPHLDAAFGLRPQQETRIMVRRELDVFPESEMDVQELAFDLGGRIEDAWGMKHRRFLDRVGDLKGQFNPRRWSL